MAAHTLSFAQVNFTETYVTGWSSPRSGYQRVEIDTDVDVAGLNQIFLLIDQNLLPLYTQMAKITLSRGVLVHWTQN